jgi:hypothetical protein
MVLVEVKSLSFVTMGNICPTLQYGWSATDVSSLRKLLCHTVDWISD